MFAVTVLLVGAPSTAAAVPPSSPTPATAPFEQLNLDSNYAWSRHLTPEVSSAAQLPKGLYVATVQGTLSYWTAKFFKKPHATKKRPWTMICGTPEAAPQFASAGGTGPVGMDAEFVSPVRGIRRNARSCRSRGSGSSFR